MTNDLCHEHALHCAVGGELCKFILLWTRRLLLPLDLETKGRVSEAAFVFTCDSCL